MSRREEIDLEIRNQAARLAPKCNALFEFPMMIYNAIMQGNATRKNPYKVSEKRIRDVVHAMPELN